MYSVLQKMAAPLLTMLFLLCGCMCPHKFMPHGEPPPLPPCHVPEDIKVALVLGSGGVRGMAHVGVLEEFEKAGIKFDMIVGCSAGSLVGALYADHPDACRVKSEVANMRTNSILDINIWESRFGLSQGTTFRKVLDDNLDADCFEELQIPLVVVATDLYSGELVPMGGGEIVKAVQASCSIPLVFVPIELHGRVLVDGGCINPVPVKVARDLGAQVIIAVDLCELLGNTFPTNLFGVANRAAEIAFLWQNQVCTKNADIIIRPKMCGIGTFNEKKKWELYMAGREAACAAIPKIKALLAALPEYDCQNKPVKMKAVELPCYTADDHIRAKEFLTVAEEATPNFEYQ